jgi:hypothetical protein
MVDMWKEGKVNFFSVKALAIFKHMSVGLPIEEWTGDCKKVFPALMEASLIPDNVSYDFCSRVNPNFEEECRDRADGEA